MLDRKRTQKALFIHPATNNHAQQLPKMGIHNYVAISENYSRQRPIVMNEDKMEFHYEDVRPGPRVG